jgi:glycosyltransferase involved in cell wall biosynthesis
VRVAVIAHQFEGGLGSSLAKGLAQAGHEATVVPARWLGSGRRPLIEARRRGLEAPATAFLTSRALKAAARLRPDAAVVIKGRFLRYEDVRRLRDALDVPVVNYYPDNPFGPAWREDEVIRALGAYDLVCIWADSLASELRAAGVARTAVIPFGYDPGVYHPPPGRVERRFDAVLVGQWYPIRGEFARQLEGLRLAITGGGWRRATRGTSLARCVLRGHHFGTNAAKLYWASGVGLNILHHHNLPGHNMRTWELPATETAMVATRTSYQQRLFGEQGAILIDRPEELRPAVEELLADDARRRAVARAGREAVAPGTYEERARQLVEQIEQAA